MLDLQEPLHVRTASFRPHIVASNEKFTETQFRTAIVRGAKAKRCMDVIFSLTILPFVFIFALPIALLIAFNGGRPIYRHIRVGQGGRRFACYKFRTMEPGADIRLQMLLENDPALRAEWFAHFKLENDPRVTPLGWFLRKTSLDEIPQILNVLKGEMSWVGPRPVIPEELSKYGASLPAYLACRPGITGLWQVNGRSNTTYEERAAFDVHYAQNRSVLLDLKILLLTIPRVLTAHGSY
jgi:exopolysaccharide production protein ExoY